MAQLNINKLLFSLAVAGLSACRAGPETAPIAPRPGAGQSADQEATPTPASEEEDEESVEELKFTEPRSQVSRFILDDQAFRVNGIRVGLQAYQNSESPVVLFFMPDAADYVEILRCNANTVIATGGEDLGNVDLGTAGANSQVYQANDFWKAAEKASGCLLLAVDPSMRTLFIDSYAASGSYRYLVHACVDAARLTDMDQLSKRNCSRQVSVSPVLSDFVNERIKTERAALEGAAKEKVKMESLSRAIYSNTVELNNALVECEANEAKRVVSVKRKQAIATVISAGVGFAGAIAGPAASGGSALQVFTAAWGAKDTAVAGAGPLADTLTDLFTTSADFPRSCTRATKAMNDGVILTSQLKASHQLYATKVDAAAAATKARVDGETTP